MKRAFPLGIISDEVSQDIKRLVDFGKEFKLDGIEIRSLFGRAFKDLTKDDVKEIGARIKGEGFKIAGCASPVFKCNIDNPAEIADHIEIFKRSVEKAIAWDCDIVRVFTFLRKNTPSPTADLKAAATHFPKLLEVVKGTNIRIGIENEYTTIVGNGAELKEFLSYVKSPIVGGVWDPCNILYMPGSGNPIADDYPMVANQVMHVHIKDALRQNGKPTEHCVEVGKGELEFPKLFADLKKRSYKGWVTLETHWRMKALTAEAQHLPAGHSFSADAEPASRICMANLIKMLEIGG